MEKKAICGLPQLLFRCTILMNLGLLSVIHLSLLKKGVSCKRKLAASVLALVRLTDRTLFGLHSTAHDASRMTCSIRRSREYLTYM